MSVIVGVHGIGKQQSGRHQLTAHWLQALHDGVERAQGSHVRVPPSFDLAFYGDAFLPGVIPGKKGVGVGAELSDLEEEECEDVNAALIEALGPNAEPSAADLPPLLGYTAVPKSLQPLLRIVDRLYGAGSALLFVGVFRQVRRYLQNTTINQFVNDRVDSTVSVDTEILVGHSLGSVVAFEHARRWPTREVSIVSLGSPLGLRAVRRLMPDPTYGRARGLPTNVRVWADVRDPRDPVTCGGPLSRLWPGVKDLVVHNGGDAHAVERYLSKAETGSAILSALTRVQIERD